MWVCGLRVRQAALLLSTSTNTSTTRNLRLNSAEWQLTRARALTFYEFFRVAFDSRRTRTWQVSWGVTRVSDSVVFALSHASHAAKEEEKKNLTNHNFSEASNFARTNLCILCHPASFFIFNTTLKGILLITQKSATHTASASIWCDFC